MSTPETLDCYHCGNPFNWTRNDSYQKRPSICDPCAAIEIKKNYRAAIEKTAGEILKKIPPRYQATDTNHPQFNAKLWERVERWRPSSERPWLGLSGPTGASKTRCAFLILREIALAMIHPARDPDAGVRRPVVAVVSAYTFGEAVAAKFTDDRDSASALLHSLRVADVLLIDDLGKQRNTPAVACELFAVIDHRHAENLCTVWTSNTSPEGIVAGMAEDMASPLAGRIRECSKIFTIQ